MATLTKKDYCDYDTCVALKKLGYNEKTLAYYTTEGFFHWIRAYIYDVAIPDLAKSSNKKPYKHIIDAMSLYEAQKWLREEKDIHIEVYACAGGYIYELCKAYKPNSFSGGTTIYTPNDVDNPQLNDAGKYETYEEALSEGIKEAIKILKEK